MMEATVPDSAWLDAAVRIAVGGVAVWGVATVQRLAVEVREIRVHLFGINGNNGQNGDFKKLRTDVDVLRSDLAHLEAKYGNG